MVESNHSDDDLHDTRRQASEHAEAEQRDDVSRQRSERVKESGLTARERQERWPIG